MKRINFTKRFIVYLMLIIGAILCVFPFYWMLRTAVVDSSSIFQTDITLLPPMVKLENFKDALSSQPFGQFFLNSLFITVCNIIGVLLTSSLCAYGFSRISWPGRDKVFGVLMTALMVPFSVLMIPHFIGWSKLGLTDTYVPLIAPAFFGGGLFNIFLLRQFFLTIPRELDEAAFMDGASHFKVYASIILPLSKTPMIVVGLLTFLANWNDFLAPMIYLSTDKKYTLMLGLTLFQGSYSAQWNYLMAAVSVVVLPSLIIYIICQKYFVEGISTTGLKG